MLDRKKIGQAARNWIDAWNNRDFKSVMAHYAEEVEFTSAAVARRWKIPEGRLTGKAELERHFRKGVEEVSGLHFTFHSILYAPDSILLLYVRENGKLAADLVRFNQDMKVIQVTCFLEEPA